MASGLAPANGYDGFTSPQLLFNILSLKALAAHLSKKATQILVESETTPQGPEFDALLAESVRIRGQAVAMQQEFDSVTAHMEGRVITEAWGENMEEWHQYFGFLAESLGMKVPPKPDGE